MRELLIALCVGFGAYALVGWYYAHNALSSMTAIERANAQIDQARRKEKKPSIQERLRFALKERGYSGDLTPVFAIMIFVYLAVIIGLKIMGIPEIVGVAIAVPLSFVIAVSGLKSLVTRRRRKFNVQLLQALTLLAAQVEAGNGAQRAIEQIIPSLQDPIRSELALTMDATVASKDLVGAMKDLESRYPTKAFRMFIAALEIDQAKGGRLEPALRQAASTLQRDFDLSKEASAEISQTKGEFIAIVGIITLITVTMVISGGDTALKAYTNPIGLIIVVIALGNFALGIFRSLKIFSGVKD